MVVLSIHTSYTARIVSSIMERSTIKCEGNMSGVSDNYCLAIADGLTEEQAKAKIMELQKLCQSIVGVQ